MVAKTKTRDGFRHIRNCRFSGMTLAEVSLVHEHCICDPHGAKARAGKLAYEKYLRRTVLYQDEVWYPREGDSVRLDEMSLRWKLNLVRFLERRAPQLQRSYLTNTEMSLIGAAEHAADQVMAEVQQDWELAPTTWLYRTPFMLRLEQLIRERHDGPEDRSNAKTAQVPRCLHPTDTLSGSSEVTDWCSLPEGHDGGCDSSAGPSLPAFLKGRS
jgi:hypothetical protein